MSKPPPEPHPDDLNSPASEASPSPEVASGPEIARVPDGYHVVPDFYGRSSGKMPDIRTAEPFATYAKNVIDSRRTMLYFDRLHTLYQAIENVAATYRSNSKRPKLLEIGVYRGGGAYFMTSVSSDMLPQRADVYCVDTFSGHSKADLDPVIDASQKLDDFRETSFENVKKYLSGYSLATVLQGRIQEYKSYFDAMHLDLIHLDVDIYAPTYWSLRFFGKRMARNGIIVVDDYSFLTCAGVKKAVDQYLDENPKKFSFFELLSGQCLLVKRN